MLSAGFEPMIPVIKLAANLRGPYGHQELMFFGLTLAEFVFNLQCCHFIICEQCLNLLVMQCCQCIAMWSLSHCLLSSAPGFEILKYCSTCHIFRQTWGGVMILIIKTGTQKSKTVREIWSLGYCSQS